MNNDSMIGHNMPDFVNLHGAIAGLGEALRRARNATQNNREQMVIVARWLVALDTASAGNTDLADSEIRQAQLVATTDAIASRTERTYARWMARGGVEREGLPFKKNANEINDLISRGLNEIEARFLNRGRFAKVTTYNSLYSAVASECKTKIRRSIDRKEGDPDFALAGVRQDYAGTLFEAETVDGWIKDENYKRSEIHQRLADLKQATSRVVESAKDDPKELDRIEGVFIAELRQIRKERAEKAAEAEAKAADAPAMTREQKRLVARGAPSDHVSKDVGDDF